MWIPFWMSAISQGTEISWEGFPPSPSKKSEVSVNNVLTFNWQVTEILPTNHQLSADCGPTSSVCLGQNLSVVCRPTDSRQSTNSLPTGALLHNQRSGTYYKSPFGESIQDSSKMIYSDFFCLMLRISPSSIWKTKMKLKPKCPKSTHMLTIFAEHGITAHTPRENSCIALSNNPVFNNDYCFSSCQKTIQFDQKWLGIFSWICEDSIHFQIKESKIICFSLWFCSWKMQNVVI